MKDEVVYVRWYKEVVEGKVVNEHDLFGMVAVRIPIQGVQAVALFTPKDIYKTAQEACGTFHKHFPTPKEIVHLEPLRPVLATSVADSISPEYNTLQQFKHDHWNHEKNMLQLEYWQEFDRMYHNYQRKRRNMMYTKEQSEHFMKMDYPISKDEAFQKRIIPSTDNADVTAFVNEWAQPKKDEVVPRTLGRTVKLTELALWD